MCFSDFIDVYKCHKSLPMHLFDIGNTAEVMSNPSARIKARYCMKCTAEDEGNEGILRCYLGDSSH